MRFKKGDFVYDCSPEIDFWLIGRIDIANHSRIGVRWFDEKTGLWNSDCDHYNHTSDLMYTQFYTVIETDLEKELYGISGILQRAGRKSKK